MKKTLLLFIVIFITACTVPDLAMNDPAETPLTVATGEAMSTPIAAQPSNNERELGENAQRTVESQPLQDEPTQTPLQPTVEIELTAEPYPASSEAADSLTEYPGPEAREPKSLVDPYPSQEQEDEEADLPVYGYRIVNEYPHDPQAFTQGLVVTNDGQEFIEGTGLWGQSSLRRVDIDTGEVLQFHALPDDVFGEGLTEVNDQIFQLTWQSNMGFIYDSDSFEQVGTFDYPHQGWGITHDGQELMVSDGTSTIYFWDAQTLEETRQIQVTSPSGPITRLNELEYYQGEILANVWQTDLIARISPEDGRVLGWIDLTGLYDVGENADPDDVLNGIAYDEQADKLYVTGKRWPVLFEIELVEIQ